MCPRALVQFLAAFVVSLGTLGHAAPAIAFDLQAHRGGRGLQPENTLAAFENALKMGVTTLELDIAITADRVAVISHEPALFPGTARDPEGRWLTQPGPLIKSLTLAQVQRYDVGRLNPEHAYGKTFASQQAQDGTRIPTLASLFALVKSLGADQVQFDIETKIFPNRPDDTVAPEEFVQILLAVIRDAGMSERVMIQSFDWRTLQLIQKLRARHAHGVPDGAEPRLEQRRRSGLDGGTPGARLPFGGRHGQGRRRHDLVAQLPEHRRSRGQAGARSRPAVHPLDRQRSGRDAKLIDWGVDGIITDYPDRLREVMRERGMALPAGTKG